MGESRTTGAARSNRGAAEICSENFREARRRKLFHILAKHAYPTQTVPNILVLTKGEYAERTVYDWLDGKTEAPTSVTFQILGEINS